MAVLEREKKDPKWQFCKKTARSSYVQPWLMAIGGRRLAVGGSWWQLVAVGGRWLVIGRHWRLVVGGWRLAVGGSWRLVEVGGWRLVVSGGGL